MQRWKGLVALVTGASSGIGAGLVQKLTNSGMNVVGCARSVDKLQNVADQLKDASGSFHPIKCDLRQEAEITAMYDVIKKEYGGVDVCILNAGLGLGSSLIKDDVDKWRQEWEVNVLARCICTREYLKSMKERGVDDGHIIHINSIMGHMVSVIAGGHHYSATKWASRALALGLRQELRQAGSSIRVTDISPGVVETPIWSVGSGSEEFTKRFLDLNQHLKSSDIEDAVEYVLSAPQHVEVNDIILANSWDRIRTKGTYRIPDMTSK